MDGVRIYRGLPKDGMTYPFEGWLTKEWAELRQVKDRLDDAAFLQAFEPIAKRFQDRRPYLDHCAEAIYRLYLPWVETRGTCKLIEIASGCDVFPECIRTRGFHCVGLEADPMVLRYCKLKGLNVIAYPGWDATRIYTRDKFHLVVLISFATGPVLNEWSAKVIKVLCESLIYQAINGAEIALFDQRHLDHIIDTAKKKRAGLIFEPLTVCGLSLQLVYSPGNRSAFFRHQT
jgi:hypothetical protein